MINCTDLVLFNHQNPQSHPRSHCMAERETAILCRFEKGEWANRNGQIRTSSPRWHFQRISWCHNSVWRNNYSKANGRFISPTCIHDIQVWTTCKNHLRSWSKIHIDVLANIVPQSRYQTWIDHSLPSGSRWTIWENKSNNSRDSTTLSNRRRHRQISKVDKLSPNTWAWN